MLVENSFVVPTPPPPLATVLLADDNPRIAGLVGRILGEEFRILGLARDGEELIEMASRLLPDVIVADIGMPRMSGILAVKRLHSWKSPAVVFLTSHADQELVNQAQAAGGLGYVLKASAAEELIDAIRAALRQEVFVSPAVGLAHETPALAK